MEGRRANLRTCLGIRYIKCQHPAVMGIEMADMINRLTQRATGLLHEKIRLRELVGFIALGAGSMEE